MNNSVIAKGFGKPTARVERLRAAIVDAVPVLDYERALLVTKAYQKYEDLTPIMRRAKTLELVLSEMQVTIRPDELVVGAPTLHPRSSDVFPEYSIDWLIDELDTLSTRETDPFYVSEEAKAALKGIQPYWKGKTNSEYALSLISKESMEAQDFGVYDSGSFLFAGCGHSVVNYEKVVLIGYRGILEEVEQAMAKLDRRGLDYIQKEQFYKALQITYNAAINFAHRYAAKAEEMAAVEPDFTRKAELHQIAKNLRHAPEYGASNFYEALQALWLTHCIIRIESNGYSYSPGPVDRYLWPVLEKDTEISREFAQELLDCLFVKFNDSCTCRDKYTAQAFAGYGLFEQVALGGQDERGRDQTNPLTYMLLETVAQVAMPQPSVGVRISSVTPDELLYRCCEVVRLGLGFPALFNDEIIIPALMNRGVPLKIARTYTPSGCVEPDIQHRTDGWHSPAFFNIAKVMELTLHNGRNGKKQLGPQTGEITDFTCIEDFVEAFRKQTDHFVRLLVENLNCVDIAHGRNCPNPFQSALIESCIEKGVSVQQGGADYNFTGPQGFAVADAGDCLYAIQKNVFEEKKITLEELRDALEHNFGYPIPDDGFYCGNEDYVNDGNTDRIEAAVRAILSGKPVPPAGTDEDPKAKYARIYTILNNTHGYGNDIDEADEFAAICFKFYAEMLEKYPNARGGIFQAGMFPVSGNVMYGRFVGALPSGRLAHQPLADGVSPSAGRDVNGPTAAANSVSKLDHALASNGTLYNQKFLPAALAGDQGLQNLAALIRGFFERKGMEIQFNVMDRQTLLDAQAHPDQYKNLVVRVAGYSAHFTKLAKATQDDIISRTEQTF